MEKLNDLLNIRIFDKHILEGIVHTFIKNGKLRILVNDNSFICDINTVCIENYFYDLSRKQYEPLLEFFKQNEFSFSEIEYWDDDYIFYYVHI